MVQQAIEKITPTNKKKSEIFKASFDLFGAIQADTFFYEYNEIKKK